MIELKKLLSFDFFVLILPSILSGP